MILINAANGQQGKLLIPKLIQAGAKIRACVRSETSADELRAAGVAEVIVGDISQDDVIARAVTGIDIIYHVCPGIQPKERDIGFAWIDAAKQAGVSHFVFSSVLHAILTDLIQHEAKRDIEEHLISSHLDYTILQPTIYMAPRRFNRVFETGVLKTGWSLDRKQSLVDVGDIADVAAGILTNTANHVGATYELSGPDRLSAHDMGAIISELTGRPIRVAQVDAETYLEGLFGKIDKNVHQHELRVSQSLQSRYTSHDFIGNPNVLGWLLGRTPTSFRQFVAANMTRS